MPRPFTASACNATSGGPSHRRKPRSPSGKLGLEVHLTEFDIDTTDEELQADNADAGFQSSIRDGHQDLGFLGRTSLAAGCGALEKGLDLET